MKFDPTPKRPYNTADPSLPSLLGLLVTVLGGGGGGGSNALSSIYVYILLSR